MICSVSFYFIFTQNFVLIRHYMSKGIIFAYKTRFKEEIRFHERLTGRNTGRERKKKTWDKLWNGHEHCKKYLLKGLRLMTNFKEFWI